MTTPYSYLLHSLLATCPKSCWFTTGDLSATEVRNRHATNPSEVGRCSHSSKVSSLSKELEDVSLALTRASSDYGQKEHAARIGAALKALLVADHVQTHSRDPTAEELSAFEVKTLKYQSRLRGEPNLTTGAEARKYLASWSL